MIGVDGSIDTDVTPNPDVVEKRSYWIAASFSRSSMPHAVLYQLDRAGDVTSCDEHPAPRINRALLAHPTLPLAYAVDSGFAGIQLQCGSTVYVGDVSIGAARTVQRIVYEPTRAIGYFTIDGPGALGLYRFTAKQDGTPTVTSSTNTPTTAGPLALDSERNMLVTASPNITTGYALMGSAMEFPPAYTTTAGCGQPTDLLVSGAYALLFCTDNPQVLRYSTSPFAYESQLAGPGPVDRVIALPGDRAIAATTAPALAIGTLSNGSMSWTTGPTLPARVTAMAVSSDGEILAVAYTGAEGAEISLWRVADQSLAPIDTMKLAGVVFSLAITAPGD